MILVDPFFHYHRPLAGFPYLVDNQLSQNPGMAAHMDYDSVILGSSMTVNFNTDWFEELMGLNTIKLSYSGAFPRDQYNIMKIIFDGKREVKTVFLGVDVITYTGGVTETKYPIPEYLYDQNYLNDIKYLLNKDVLLNYILRPLRIRIHGSCDRVRKLVDRGILQRAVGASQLHFPKEGDGRDKKRGIPSRRGEESGREYLSFY